MGDIAAQLEMGRAGLKKAAARPATPPAAAEGLAGALSQIKSGAFQLKKPKAAPAPAQPATTELVQELKASMGGKYGLRPTGMRSKSGRMIIDSDRSDGVDPKATLNMRANLRKHPRQREEPPREMTELEKIREKMANKMKERLRQMEEQDVADSWEDEPLSRV
jgi:hypothetical protein